MIYPKVKNVEEPQTEHEPIFFKSTQNPNRTEPLSSKNANRIQTQNFWDFSISTIIVTKQLSFYNTYDATKLQTAIEELS